MVSVRDLVSTSLESLKEESFGLRSENLLVWPARILRNSGFASETVAPHVCRKRGRECPRTCSCANWFRGESLSTTPATFTATRAQKELTYLRFSSTRCLLRDFAVRGPSRLSISFAMLPKRRFTLRQCCGGFALVVHGSSVRASSRHAPRPRLGGRGPTPTFAKLSVALVTNCWTSTSHLRRRFSFQAHQAHARQHASKNSRVKPKTARYAPAPDAACKVENLNVPLL